MDTTTTSIATVVTTATAVVALTLTATQVTAAVSAAVITVIAAVTTAVTITAPPTSAAVVLLTVRVFEVQKSLKQTLAIESAIAEQPPQSTSSPLDSDKLFGVLSQLVGGEGMAAVAAALGRSVRAAQGRKRKLAHPQVVSRGINRCCQSHGGTLHSSGQRSTATAAEGGR